MVKGTIATCRRAATRHTGVPVIRRTTTTGAILDRAAGLAVAPSAPVITTAAASATFGWRRAAAAREKGACQRRCGTPPSGGRQSPGRWTAAAATVGHVAGIATVQAPTSTGCWQGSVRAR